MVCYDGFLQGFQPPLVIIIIIITLVQVVVVVDTEGLELMVDQVEVVELDAGKTNSVGVPVC